MRRSWGNDEAACHYIASRAGLRELGSYVPAVRERFSSLHEPGRQCRRYYLQLDQRRHGLLQRHKLDSHGGVEHHKLRRFNA
jgi:hypothetical protein